MRTPEGGVETLELSSGRRLWRSAAPARPLLVGRESAFLLEERGGRLRIAEYASRSGKPRRAVACSLALPGSLGEPAAGRRWTTFAVYSRRRADVLEVEYDVRCMIGLGIPPGHATESEAHGVMRLDLASGRLDQRPGERLERPPFHEPVPAGNPRPLNVHARAADATLALGGPPPDFEGVLVAGERRFLFEWRPDRKGVRIRRWNAVTKQESPPLEITADFDAVWPSVDRGYVGLRRAHDQARVDLHSLETGARIATLERPTDFAVYGSRVLWTTYAGRDQLVLIASASGGRQLWRRTVWRAGPPGEPIP